jgi:hypothetical protein
LGPALGPARKRIGIMHNGAATGQPNKPSSDDDILGFDVSDAALEAAAQAIPGAAMSFPNAPTVSIIVICCSFD